MKATQKTNYFNILFIGIFITLLLQPSESRSQALDSENRVSVSLDDGTEITLLGKASTGTSNRFTGEYYYLPTNLKLSKRTDGVPEFLFTKFTTEQDASAGGVQGALMHFLMEWGLTAAQESELQTKLEEKIDGRKNEDSPFGRHIKTVSKVKVMGPAEVEPLPEESFQIYSASLSDPGSANIIKSGRAPSLEGGKAVVASKMDKNTAQLMASSFEETSSIADLSVTLAYQYSVMMPAIDASITVNWSKVTEVFDSLSTVYSKRTKRYGWFGTIKKNTYSYEEMHEIYKEVQERKAIRVNIVDNSLGDQTSAMVLEAFMSYFTNSLTNRSMEVPSVAPKDEEGDKPNTQKGRYYTYNSVKNEKQVEKGIETIRLNYRKRIPRIVDVTGNLKSWYNGVKDNPACVSEINLNDPFFEHRNISFILDIEGEEIFNEAINYATIEVRKKRSSGNDFSDRVTFDKKFLKENGVTASMTYARDGDSNSDVFEYRTQWSLRGGKVYPQNPAWKKGEWEGVTLSPPVGYRNIEVEADLDELKEKEISRVTVQVRYMQFGEEQETNIHVSPAKGESLVEKKIFIDKNTKGYACRIIVNHKKEGKLVLPWTARINDDYIYATLPEGLQDIESPIFIEAKEEGKQVLTKAKDKVLDKFSEIFE